MQIARKEFVLRLDLDEDLKSKEPSAVEMKAMGGSKCILRKTKKKH